MSGPARRKNYDNNDITLDMLHRASVVANTKIRYQGVSDEKMLYHDDIQSVRGRNVVMQWITGS